MNDLNNFFLGVQQVAQDAVDKAPYDRTFRGVIKQINEDGTCNLEINHRQYDNVKCPVGLQVNEVVDVLFPQNNVSRMEIVHRGDGIETVAVTNDTTNFTSHSVTLKKYNNLGICLFRAYCVSTNAFTSTDAYDVCQVPNDVAPSFSHSFATRCYAGAARYSISASIGSGGIVTIRPTNPIPSGASFYITGFWFL